MRANKSMTRIDGGTNRISRAIFVADSGVPRLIAFRSRPAGSGFLRLAFFSGLAVARAVIKGVVVHHKPRMACALEHPHQFAELDVLLDGDDVGARHHDVADAAFAQAEDCLLYT